MRSIAEIKESITTTFMANADVQKVYGIKAGERFSDHFGRLSVENVLMYVVAVCCHVVEGLMDNHRNEVAEMLESRLPHRLRWYRDRALEFMSGCELDGDSGQYDTMGMSEKDINEARVVKYAAVNEREDDGVLQIKIAGESSEGKRKQLSVEIEDRFKSYMNEIKDAGVRLEVVNQPPGLFLTSIDVYYNPLYDKGTVEKNCAMAVTNYVNNLDFDGVLFFAELLERVCQVDGVVTAKFVSAQVNETGPDADVDLAKVAYVRPVAGYYEIDRLEINMNVYE